MDITRSNFVQCLPLVEEAVRNATFLAFDCELTGLGEYDQFPILSYDVPEVIYHQFLMRSQSFNICQFGLCCFQSLADAEDTRFSYHAFNFSVFNRPLHLGIRIQDKNTEYFSCQASSLDFLASQNFDFNKWIREGISYLGLTERSRLEEELGRVTDKRMKEGESLATKKPREPSIPDEEKPALNRVIKRIKVMLADPIEDTIEFNDLNGFQRKLLYSYLQSKFGSTLFVESIFPSSDVRESVLIVKKITPECPYKKLVLDSAQQKMDQIEEGVGFCKLLQMISNSRKPLVGHNVFLDLMHVMKILENGYMNEKIGTFASFTTELHQRFPEIYDSKVFAQQKPLKNILRSNTLNHLYDQIKQSPFRQTKLVPADSASAKYGDPGVEAKLHEAGYDAFITGCIFIAETKYFADFKKTKAFKNSAQPESCLESSLLAPFVNKVSIGKVVDMPYFHLSGHNVIPDRSHILVLQLPSDSFSHSDVIKMFEKIGFVKVTWINHTSCFVDLGKPENASIAKLKFLENAQKNKESGTQQSVLISCFEFLSKRASDMVHPEDVLKTKPHLCSIRTAAGSAKRPHPCHAKPTDAPLETRLKSCSMVKTLPAVQDTVSLGNDAAAGELLKKHPDGCGAWVEDMSKHNISLAETVVDGSDDMVEAVPTSILVDLTTDTVSNALRSVDVAGFETVSEVPIDEIEPEPC